MILLITKKLDVCAVQFMATGPLENTLSGELLAPRTSGHMLLLSQHRNTPYTSDFSHKDQDRVIKTSYHTIRTMGSFHDNRGKLKMGYTS